MVEYRGYKFNDYSSGTMRVSQYQKMIDLLEQHKPMRICEMGSGISTIIFEQYCQKYGATMFSIEHKPQYKRANTVMFPVYEYTSHQVAGEYFEKCNRYVGMTKWLRTQEPFDFVLCDGPYGCGYRQTYNYGRVQIVSFPLQDKLTDNSIVIIHDSNRQPEQNTMARLRTFFERKNFSFTEETDQELETMTVFYLTRKSE